MKYKIKDEKYNFVSVTYISPFAFHDTDLRGVNFVSDYSYADSLVDSLILNRITNARIELNSTKALFGVLFL